MIALPATCQIRTSQYTFRRRLTAVGIVEGLPAPWWPARRMRMPWQLSGQMIETCSCNMMCPCWYGVPELAIQDRGWCASAIAFRIDQGNADGVPLSGRTVVLAVDFPD